MSILGLNPTGSATTYVILTYASRSGDFSTFNLPPGCTANPTGTQYQIICP